MSRLWLGSAPVTKGPLVAPRRKPAADVRSSPAMRSAGPWHAWHLAAKMGRIFVSKYSVPAFWAEDKLAADNVARTSVRTIIYRSIIQASVALIEFPRFRAEPRRERLLERLTRPTHVIALDHID